MIAIENQDVNLCCSVNRKLSEPLDEEFREAWRSKGFTQTLEQDQHKNSNFGNCVTTTVKRIFVLVQLC